MRSMRGWIIVSIGALTTLAGSAAFAGLVLPAAVNVDLAKRSATGDMVSARYSANSTEYIGCGMHATVLSTGGAFRFGFCQAEDAAGEAFTCSTSNADFVDAIEASAAFSYVRFNWNEDGVCTSVGFSNQSFYLPVGLSSNSDAF